ncbi:hypothetical protein P7K49_028610 [Saguinus oedipus]|uniref:Uncharacterized protein n=1 Tax=Saguinus oedipus TaxID=9490 RepID=A0ABQ9U4U5_SAGOE|nr:hypothetical protein P7K49_028610 [Saguinus oedipus]
MRREDKARCGSEQGSASPFQLGTPLTAGRQGPDGRPGGGRARRKSRAAETGEQVFPGFESSLSRAGKAKQKPSLGGCSRDSISPGRWWAADPRLRAIDPRLRAADPHLRAAAYIPKAFSTQSPQPLGTLRATSESDPRPPGSAPGPLPSPGSGGSPVPSPGEMAPPPGGSLLLPDPGSAPAPAPQSLPLASLPPLQSRRRCGWRATGKGAAGRSRAERWGRPGRGPGEGTPPGCLRA